MVLRDMVEPFKLSLFKSLVGDFRDCYCFQQFRSYCFSSSTICNTAILLSLGTTVTLKVASVELLVE